MTPVAFHFLTPLGVPIGNTRFEVQLSKAAFNKDVDGVIMPRLVEGITDAQGRCTLQLWPLSQPYIVVMFDPISDAGIQYRFTVPEVGPGAAALDFQDLIVEASPASGTAISEEALMMILSAKGAVLAARNDVLAKTSLFSGQAERAEAAAEAAEAAAASINGGLPPSTANYIRRSDVVNPTTIYRGEAAPGSADTALVWRISKTTVAYGSPITVQTTWAGGTQAFDKKWADRATYNYN